MTHLEVNNSNKCSIWFSSFVSSLTLSPWEDRLWNSGLLTGNQRITFYPLVSSQEKNQKMATSQNPLYSASIFFMLSLTRYFRKLLEIAFNLFQRSQQQRFLLHCYVHTWSAFAISISAGYIYIFEINCTAANEKYWCSRLQMKQDRLFLHVY